MDFAFGEELKAGGEATEKQKRKLHRPTDWQTDRHKRKERKGEWH